MPFAACRRSASERPSRLGVNWSSSTAAVTRSRVSSATLAWPCMTRETVAMETPARLATSRIVGLIGTPLAVEIGVARVFPSLCNRFL